MSSDSSLCYSCLVALTEAMVVAIWKRSGYLGIGAIPRRLCFMNEVDPVVGPLVAPP